MNRSKGNKTELTKAELIQKSAYCRVSGTEMFSPSHPVTSISYNSWYPMFAGRDMDLLELSAFGNVRRAQDSGGCSIQ